MSIILSHNQGRYIMEYIQVTKHQLFHGGGRYRNQSIDLLCKLMNWFLYDKDIRHERVKTLFTHHTPKVCSYMPQSRICFFCFFFLLGLFFHEYHDSQISRGRGRLFFLILLYHFNPLYRKLKISQVITAESSPLRITGSRNQTRNLWFFL